MEKKLITLISSPFLSKKWKVEDSHSQHVIRIFEKNKKNKGGGKKNKDININLTDNTNSIHKFLR